MAATTSINKQIMEAAIASPFEATPDEVIQIAPLLNTINAVEGLIGSGKTTFLNNIKAYLDSLHINADVVSENPNRDFLTLFYSDMKKYAFSFQMDMLRQRQRSNEVSLDLARRPSVVLNDRSMIGDPVFFTLHVDKGNIDLEEAAVYLSVLRSMGPYRYDRVVFFDVESEQALYRVKVLRKNPAESGLTVDYMKELRRAYYRQMRSLAVAAKTRVVYIYNEPFCEVKDAIRKIIAAPSAEKTAEMFSLAPHLPDDATEEEVSAAFAIIRRAYKGYYFSQLCQGVSVGLSQPIGR